MGDDEAFEYDVATLKIVLLAVPVVAYSMASGHFQRARDDNDWAAIKVWDQVLCELKAEGYAPDAIGNPGPSVKNYHDSGVLASLPGVSKGKKVG